MSFVDLDVADITDSDAVLLESREKLKILYTGDFRYSQVKIVKADSLVTEATYGNPDCVRGFSGGVETGAG